MAKQLTNYIEIQRDEIEALRSIYMDDFAEEEIKTGAWNKIKDRAFKITVKNNFSDESHLALTLSVSFPSTYPKSIPNLTLRFDEGIPPDAREAAERVIRNKPSQLIGREMIFEIATALQEILESASEGITAAAGTLDPNNEKIPNLLQEREIQRASASQKAKEAEDERSQNQRENDEEEQQRLLSYMLEQEKARIVNRKNKQPATPDPFETKENAPGCLQFDQLIKTKDAGGTIATFHTVHNKVEYRKGPVTDVFTAQPLGWPVGSAPFLVLKECIVNVQEDAEFLTKSIQDLESHLDMLKYLTPHPNIMKPLNFNIQKTQQADLLTGTDWNISVLSPLAAKGSLKDILEAVGSLNVETIRTWAIQLLEGLDFYHRNGISHAGVHIGNIILEDAETDNVVVRLSDGVYQHDLHNIVAQAGRPYRREAAMSWTAPEVISNSNAKPIAATDIWDLGVVILQMMFGSKITLQQISPNAFLDSRDVSRSIEDLLNYMVHSDEKKRKSAFELKMFEFFRTGETLLHEMNPPHLITENLGAVFMTSTATNPRRESIHFPRNHSRYLNDFTKIGRLGRGGYGEVVKVRHKLENQVYAIKIIRQTSASALSKVLSEIVMLSQLNHPNVVRYFTAWTENEEPHRPESSLSSSSSSSISLTNGGHDDLFTKSSGGLDFIGAEPPEIIFGYDDDDESPHLKASEGTDEVRGYDTQSQAGSDHWNEDISEGESDQVLEDQVMPERRRRSSSQDASTKTILYIQMQYCERQTLRDLIRNGLFSKPKEYWRLFRQILQGLVHIHASAIVHRDLKPENIFIDYQNDVRIGDFGLARPGDQVSIRKNSEKDAYTNFTRSVGTTFYVAPEARSAGKGIYNEKADMFALGIILFEMCFPMITGMERAESLSKIRREDHTLPAYFEQPDNSTQGRIILSLITHQPSDRPSSADLLSSGQIPAQPEDELIRAMLRNLRDPKSTLRRDLLAAIFSAEGEDDTPKELLSATEPRSPNTDIFSSRGIEWDNSDNEEPSLDPARVLEELAFDLARPRDSPDDIHVQGLVKRKLISIFRLHGAVELPGPLCLPFSKFYSSYSNTAFKLLRHDNKMMQTPYDLTLPHARYLAVDAHPVRKSFTFGDVWRDIPSEQFPKVIGEVDFNIVSHGRFDHAIREAEIIKTVDEVVDSFPSIAGVQLCYHINHSRVLDAILKFCRIDRYKRPAVKDEISKLNFDDWTWWKLKHNLRAPPFNIAATSLEELKRFDFREICETAIPRLRSILGSNAELDAAFSSLQSIVLNLSLLNVKRRVYINPLSSFNERFFRGEFLFQCIYDNKRRDVFAAGGRYDRLVRYFLINPKIHPWHAVGFSMNWHALCASMLRYHQKALTRLKSGKAADQDGDNFWIKRRCDVLVDSFDQELLLSTGMEIVAQLWSNGLSAELGIDVNLQDGPPQSLAKEFRDVYTSVVLIKSDGALRVKNVFRKEEIELARSELIGWLRAGTRDRERVSGRKDERTRVHRHSSHQDPAGVSGDREAHIRILGSHKKINRKTIIEEAQAQVEDMVRQSLDGPLIAAIETKDETFEALRGTRLSDPESWNKFIQSAPPAERQYLGQVHLLMKDMAKNAKPNGRNAFIYNFRTKTSIPYDLGLSS